MFKIMILNANVQRYLQHRLHQLQLIPMASLERVVELTSITVQGEELYNRLWRVHQSLRLLCLMWGLTCCKYRSQRSI